MPRSAFVRDLLDRPADDPTGRPAWMPRSPTCIALQEAAGLDVVSDGEWRRRSYIGVIAEIMARLRARDPRRALLAHRRGAHARRRARLLGEEARFLVAPHATRHQGRASLARTSSPSGCGTRRARATPTRPARRSCARWSPFCAASCSLSATPGVTVAQFDDPHLCLLADPRVRAELADPDAEAELCVDLLNEIVDGVDGILTAVHLCRRNKARGGWVGEGGYDPIVPALRRLEVRPVRARVHHPGGRRLRRPAPAPRRPADRAGLRGLSGRAGRARRRPSPPASSRPCATSTPSASGSTRTAASPPAARPTSRSTKPTPSCGTRSRRPGSCARVLAPDPRHARRERWCWVGLGARAGLS